jgi:ABC-type phosphate/phosphonate transport system substrate-binding protein
MSGIASLAMYPFGGWRAATEALWSEVRREMPDLPPLAEWPGTPHQDWRDPDLVVSMTCGWPLVTSLAGTVRVVGAFGYRTPTWAGDHYRSVIVARSDDTRAWDIDRIAAVDTAAVNSTDSLSGWVSLLDVRHRTTGRRSWPGTTVITGSHLASLAAVRTGTADIASIDAVTHAHVRRDRPDLLAGLAVVDVGPLVPCLPLICRIDRDDDWVDSLRAALDIATRRTATAAATLMIDGFSPLDESAYSGLVELRPET